MNTRERVRFDVVKRVGDYGTLYAADFTASGSPSKSLTGAQTKATGGDRQFIAGRNAARDLLLSVNSRERHSYCSASGDIEGTLELAKINTQSHRAPGEAQPQPLPDAPGPATFDAATRELTVPVLPAHTSFLRAYRQPAGGPSVSASVSNTNKVSGVGFSPLTPGVTHELGSSASTPAAKGWRATS